MIRKRSITLQGHRTSISLEDPFWQALQDIANHQNQSVMSLVSEIDSKRMNTNDGLSSAIRVFVLEYYMKEKAKSEAT